jgi:surface antigen
MKSLCALVVLSLTIAACASPGPRYAGGPYPPPRPPQSYGGDPYGPPPPPPPPGYDDRSARWGERYPGPYTYNDDVYYRECRNQSDPAGVIGGALIGGLIGNRLGNRGNRAGPTVAGVVIGGLAGAALTSRMTCEDQSYAYRTYHEGLNRGPGRYEWYNPQTRHRGEFYVEDYYNDPYGHRCAEYSQTIWVQGRPEEATGYACQQPDGTWQLVS